jgi:hypothetical protein
VNSSRPAGQHRGIAFVILMSIFTLGIYYLYWLYKSFAEVRGWRGEGVSGIVGLLLSLIVVGIFLLPSYVGRMYKERTGSEVAPISGWTGLFVLVPYVGGIIWQYRIQTMLNEFWEAETSGAPGGASQTATA